ncbi:MAG: ATP-binding cassette domain-containing protein [Candidatus Thermoplasmatota archaeon]|jgi:ABC-2 type transport system ATP-binding protein|nr:ATP-binding cassette domain-containing protein [Candidatus Thermoplasmatota archaeon]MCL5791161.1 ATP-binding cassette domain-containing protein [Candidatus Thermoplasmatota archaeon]
MESNEIIVETKDLVKTYPGGIKAVQGINLKIMKGQIYGFLGPNGAGKSTTIKMLSTSIKPTSGTATILGYDIVKDSMNVRRVIGVVPQDLTTDEDLKGIENIEMVARFYDIPRKEARSKAEELLSLVDLSEFGNKYVSSYSGGMRKRLELVVGLVHSPQVLFLDEPTLGLDVQTRTKMWDYIRKIRDDLGVTIILTSHYLEEVDSLADLISIIDHGKIIVTGTSDELKSNLKGDIIQVEFSSEEDARKFGEYGNKIDVSYPHPNEARMKVKDADTELPDIMKYLVANEIKPLKLSVHRPSLDQVFLEYTGREIREEESGDVRRSELNMRRLRR